MADTTDEKKEEPVENNAEEEQQNNTDTPNEEPVETQPATAPVTTAEPKEQSGISDIVSKDLDGVEKYINNFKNKEDMKLFVDLVDKGLPASKAYDTVIKVTEREQATEDKGTVETSKAPKTIQDIVSKHL